MGGPTLEHELVRAKQEIADLQELLKGRTKEVHQLEMGMNFHVLKSQELQEILDAKDVSSRNKLLEAQALKNTGLTIQMKELRYQLDTATSKSLEMEQELKGTNDTVARLVSERKSLQQKLVEMSGVIRVMGQIEIDYQNIIPSVNDNANSDSGHITLDIVKRKIAAIELDRQRKIQQNQQLQTDVFEKDIELESLRKKVCELSQVSKQRDLLQQENQGLRTTCKNQSNEIDTLKKQISYFEETDERSRSNDETHSEMEVQLQDDGSTVVLPQALNVVYSFTGGSEEQDYPSTTSCTSDSSGDVNNDQVSKADQTATSLYTDGEGSRKAEHKLAAMETKNAILHALNQANEEEVTKLRAQLDKTQDKVQKSKKKQEVQTKYLKDVIFQYKELQKEHDETKQVVSHLKHLIEQNKEVLPEKSAPFSSATLTLTPTVDSTETPATRALPDDRTTEHGGSKDEATPSSHILANEIRRLEDEYSRLEIEHQDALSRVATLEYDLAAATEQCADANAISKLRETEMEELTSKHDQLQVDYQEAHSRASTLQAELDAAKAQANEAKNKQQEREQDLWTVIDQYKRLSEEKEGTNAKIQSVESELGSTQAKMVSVTEELTLVKKKMTRRRYDLIFDNHRLEQDLQEKVREMEMLEKELRLAQAVAARSKEDAKCVRARLAGSHHQFQKLQSQYTEAMTQKAEMERATFKAERHVELLKKQQECWSQKLDFIRQKRNEVAVENAKLLEENKDLKFHRGDLLTLPSKCIAAV